MISNIVIRIELSSHPNCISGLWVEFKVSRVNLHWENMLNPNRNDPGLFFEETILLLNCDRK